MEQFMTCDGRRPRQHPPGRVIPLVMDDDDGRPFSTWTVIVQEGVVGRSCLRLEYQPEIWACPDKAGRVFAIIDSTDGDAQAAVLDVSEWERRLDIGELFVFPAYRRLGLASALMDALYAYAARDGKTIVHSERSEEGEAWWAAYTAVRPALPPSAFADGMGDIATLAFI